MEEERHRARIASVVARGVEFDKVVPPKRHIFSFDITRSSQSGVLMLAKLQ